VTIKQTTANGSALIIKSSKVRPDLEAISIPMGLPRTVAAEPILVVKTEITTKGTGFTSK